MWICWTTGCHVLFRTELDFRRFYHTTQNSTRFKTLIVRFWNVPCSTFDWGYWNLGKQKCVWLFTIISGMVCMYVLCIHIFTILHMCIYMFVYIIFMNVFLYPLSIFVHIPLPYTLWLRITVEKPPQTYIKKGETHKVRFFKFYV